MKITREKITRRLKRIRHELSSRSFPLRKSTALKPVLSYALQAPLPGEIATGGRVKLIALAAAFPENRKANLLYLVSSALPANYRFWVERAIAQGIPIVLNQNGVATPGWAGNQTDAINAPLKWVLERANVVLYQSEFCKKSADRFLGPAKGISRIVYNAVDLKKFTPNLKPIRRPLTILLGGSQYQKYRLTSALEAFALVQKAKPDARLLISGKVDWQNDPKASFAEAQSLARHLGVEKNVEFTGSFLQVDAPHLYRRADLLLHTKYNDPCPTAVIEALACGLGVVHSRSGGLPELVDSRCGVEIPIPESYDVDHVTSPNTWADSILKAATKLEKFSVESRKRAEEKFGDADWIRLHGDAFENILKTYSVISV